MATLKTKAGDRVSKRMTDDLAAEAEAGYDLRKARAERIGRPPLDGKRPARRLALRLPADLYEELHARAEAKGRNMSALVRDAVEAYLRRRAG